MLIQNFRHNRLFNPNELQAELLRLKLSYLWPDYRLFKYSADQGTKDVITYLKAKINKLSEQTEKLLIRKLSELNAFNQKNFKKYHGNPKGWHIVVEGPTDEEQKEERMMALLLLDKEKYGI
jgi:hypothetical protein